MLSNEEYAKTMLQIMYDFKPHVEKEVELKLTVDKFLVLLTAASTGAELLDNPISFLDDLIKGPLGNATSKKAADRFAANRKDQAQFLAKQLFKNNGSEGQQKEREAYEVIDQALHDAKSTSIMSKETQAVIVGFHLCLGWLRGHKKHAEGFNDIQRILKQMGEGKIKSFDLSLDVIHGMGYGVQVCAEGKVPFRKKGGSSSNIERLFAQRLMEHLEREAVDLAAKAMGIDLEDE